MIVQDTTKAVSLAWKGTFINDVVSRGKVELHMGTPLNYELVHNPHVGQKDNLGERGSILAQF